MHMANALQYNMKFMNASSVVPFHYLTRRMPTMSCENVFPQSVNMHNKEGHIKVKKSMNIEIFCLHATFHYVGGVVHSWPVIYPWHYVNTKIAD